MNSRELFVVVMKALGVAEIFIAIALMAGNAVSLFFGIYSTTPTSREPAMLISFFAPGVAQIVAGVVLFFAANWIARKVCRTADTT